MPNTKTNRDGLLVTENVRIFLMKTDGNGPGAAGKESVMNLLGMRSLGKIKEKGEKIMFWIELVIMLLLGRSQGRSFPYACRCGRRVCLYIYL